VDKYIWTIVASDESITFRVIEKLDRAFDFPAAFSVHIKARAFPEKHALVSPT
jgi:hypothetical protein